MHTSEEAARISFFERQRVIIRIWTSGLNPHTTTGASVGHVAIRTSEIYTSLWPASGRPYYQLHTEQDDRDAEGRPPEYQFSLYTLDVSAIKDEFENVQRNLTQWAMTGPALTDGAESCASCAWRLLQAGGIERLISKAEQQAVSSRESVTAAALITNLFKRAPLERDGLDVEASSRHSSYSSEAVVSMKINSPDMVAQFVRQAKLTELKRETLTADISYEGDTEFASRRNCYIL